MRVAVPVWSGRIAPVLDTAQHLICFDVERNGQQVLYHRDWSRDTLCGRVLSVLDMGVDVLICGALSRPCLFMLQARGVDVQPFLCGSVEEILDSYRNGRLGSGAFRMPGSAVLFADPDDGGWISWFARSTTSPEG